jgi:hypothetical protein
MIDLSKYKNAFGKPGEGLRRFRIFNIAIFDVLVTMIIVYLLCWFTKLPYWNSLFVIFILGIVLHRMFHVRTGIDKLLFPNAK